MTKGAPALPGYLGCHEGVDADETFVLLLTALSGLVRSRDTAVFEEFLSDLGKAFAAGLLTGGALVATRRAAVRGIGQHLRLPWSQGTRDRKHVERRLMAILSVDVVGYSRLMNADEEVPTNAC